MDISAQGGGTPQTTEPTSEGVQSQGVPVTQEPDYKSFFEEHMQSRQREHEELQVKLSDEKLSREDRLSIREKELALREELMKYGTQQKPTADLSFIPESKQQLLRETLSKVSRDEAEAILGFTRQLFEGLNAPQKIDPVNLDRQGGFMNQKGTVPLTAAALVGEDSDAARKGFWELLGQIGK